MHLVSQSHHISEYHITYESVQMLEASDKAWDKNSILRQHYVNSRTTYEYVAHQLSHHFSWWYCKRFSDNYFCLQDKAIMPPPKRCKRNQDRLSIIHSMVVSDVFNYDRDSLQYGGDLLLFERLPENVSLGRGTRGCCVILLEGVFNVISIMEALLRQVYLHPKISEQQMNPTNIIEFKN